MKKLLAPALLLLIVSPLFADPYTPKKLPPLRVIEDFSKEEPGKFPASFRTYPFQRGKAMQVYSVAADSENRYLKAFDDKGISVQAFRKFFWETQRWPHFSWKWRAVTLPKGGDERNGMPNDSACGIYVTFGGYTGKAIKYVWSTTLPAGTIVEKKPNKFYIIVKESGPAKVGSWQTVNVNVVEDHRKVFKAEPAKNPDGFGLLTDGNATHTTAACDYDNFKISETPF
jgi:hypothetical protein